MFTLLYPLLDPLDAVLGTLSPGWRLALWATLAAVGSMLLYALLSPAAKVKELKREIGECRAALNGHEGELAAAAPLLRRSMMLAMRQVWLTFWPAVIASFPLLFLLPWLSEQYSYQRPPAGADVLIDAEPAAAGLSLQPGSPVAPGEWSAAWPDAPPLQIDVHERSLDYTIALDTRTPMAGKHRWWHLFFPGGAYLPDSSTLETLSLQLERRSFVDLGPRWLGYWETIFFSVLILVSLIVRWALGID